ncbi:MAG: amidohydrolase [Bacteroidota bacterium]
MKTFYYSLFVSVFLLLTVSCQKSNTSADLIIFNGTIYTADESLPQVEAVAVSDGKIQALGSAEEIMVLADSTTQKLDLEGKTLIPGFIESHGHIMNLGYEKLNLDLRYVKNYQELVDMVAEVVKNTPKGEWILGRGWHQSKWDQDPPKVVTGYQTHDLLSAVSPDHPVWLRHASGHASFGNAKAMEIAGITAETEFTDDGEIIKDENGQPTGIFSERAASLIENFVPKTTPAKHEKALELAIRTCLEQGITSFQDAGSGKVDIAQYKKFKEEGRLDINLWSMLHGRDSVLLDEWYEQGPMIDEEGHLTVRAIKLYADGALGSRGAWLLDAYADRKDHFGNKVMPMEYISKVSTDGLANGFQVCTHAIGDRANQEVLNIYEETFTEANKVDTDHRFRIEHAQHLDLSDIPRFSELGVIASMQGIHMSSDRPWAIFRLGKQRIINGAYVWQKLLQSGAKVINGTDAPVEPVNPIPCFYASVTRKTLQQEPKGGYEADQKMTREQALRSYTLDAAYGAFEEDIKGSLTVGKIADFAILNQDIMTVPEEEILDTKVHMTIVRGEIKYKAEENQLSTR